MCMASYKWVFDAQGLLNDFVRRVVVVRRDSGLHSRAQLVAGGFGISALRDFVPPSPFLVIRDKVAKTSQILVEPHLVDAEFREAWMPFFCRSGHPVVTVEQFLQFVDPLSSSGACFGLAQDYFLGRIFKRWLRQRSLRLVVWMGGPVMTSSHCQWHGSLDWLFSIIWWRPMLFGLKDCWVLKIDY